MAELTVQLSATACVETKLLPKTVAATTVDKTVSPATDETVERVDDLPCVCVFSETTINSPRLWLKITRYCLFILIKLRLMLD